MIPKDLGVHQGLLKDGRGVIRRVDLSTQAHVRVKEDEGSLESRLQRDVKDDESERSVKTPRKVKTMKVQ